MTDKPNDVRVSRGLKCWSCKAVFTLSEHGNCDGCCWKCGVEIDLDEMDIQPGDQQGEPFGYWYEPYGLPSLGVFHKTVEPSSGSHCNVQPLYRHAQAIAAKVDENAEFEKWRKEQIASLIRMGYPDAAKAFRDLGSVQWAGWQARANLNTPQ